MNLSPEISRKTGFGIDLAFAVVVLASYFATFSTLTDASSWDVALMVFLGILYIAAGIYGFSYCMNSSSLPVRLAYFLIQIPLGTSIVYLGKGAGFNAMVLFPLAGHSVMLLHSLWVYAANFFIAAAYLAASLALSGSVPQVWSGLPTFAAGQIFIVLFTQMAINEQRGQSEVERLVGELAEANQRLRDYALQVEELTITKERNRMAREIHDGLGHYLTTIHMQIQAASAVLKSHPAQSKEALNTALILTQEALAEIRTSVAALRTTAEDSLPIEQRITNLLNNCRLAGINPHFNVIGESRQLSPQVVWTIFRAAQEGINNACKHSKADNLWISLDYSKKHDVLLNIKDNGVGAASTNGGFGLIGLEERVNLLNGEIKMITSQGEGFEIEIRLSDK